MPRLTDPSVVEAVTTLEAEVRQLRDAHEVQTSRLDAAWKVVSALHDLMLEAQERPLRSIPGGKVG